MYICEVCCYKTNRKSNFTDHINRKKPCKASINITPAAINITPACKKTCCTVPFFGEEDQMEPEYAIEAKEACVSFVCVKCDKHLKSKFGLTKHEKICKGVDKYHCQICLKEFSSSNGKYKHMKNVTCCEPKRSVEILENEVERLRAKVVLLESSKLINITNITNNNVIQLNSYDNPYTEHITNKLMAGIFRLNKTDPNLILNDTVRSIYKNKDHPENNSIKLLDRSAYTKVYKGDKEITLPMDEVLQTILTKMSELCCDRLRDCEEEGWIPGKKVGFVKNIMDTLAMDDREDRDSRLKYIPYIKSALLE